MLAQYVACSRKWAYIFIESEGGGLSTFSFFRMSDGVSLLTSTFLSHLAWRRHLVSGQYKILLACCMVCIGKAWGSLESLYS